MTLSRTGHGAIDSLGVSDLESGGDGGREDKGSTVMLSKEVEATRDNAVKTYLLP